MKRSARRSSDSSFQIGPGMRVVVEYSARDAEGEPVEEGVHELEYVHGYGALLPSLEIALEGRHAGAELSVVLPPEEAFGPRREERIVEFARDEFPPDVAGGDHLEAENAEGGLVVLRVLEVHEDAVIVDTNHPLAGQSVEFRLRVLAVAPASAEELASAEAAMSAAEEAPPEAGPALLPVERLLQGATRRYQLDPPRPEPPVVPALDGATDDDET